MDAVEKTKTLGRTFLPIHQIEPNPNNPNEMSDAEFNMLSDNIEKTGITDPILVRQIGEDRYRTIGGHHRIEVAKVMGFEEVPCTIITDPEFDDDQEQFQVVRMNVIRGRMSPDKFMQMYSSLSAKYADEVMQEAFGFVEEAEFKKLIGQVKKSLPKELQKDFQEAAKELKTIDDLSKLLNRLFTTYGSNLPYGFMCFDFGGKDSIWLRMSTDTRKAILTLGEQCIINRRTVDDLIGGLIRKAAKGELSEHLLQLIAESDVVEIPAGVKVPTAEVLAGNTVVA